MSVNAVKQRLFYARNTMKKELHMVAPASTTQISFPINLKIQTMGESAHQHAPLHPARLTQTLLVKRLLYLCRKAPKSKTELGTALGIETVYLEDIIPDLIAGEVLQEEATGTYIAPFIYGTTEEFESLTASVPAAAEGLPIIKKYLSSLIDILQHTTMARDQAYDINELLWLGFVHWLPYSLYRHLDLLPTWGRYRINIKPVRPVDSWYLLGWTEAPGLQYAIGATTKGPTNGIGRLHIKRWPCTKNQVWIDHGDQERYIGRLSRTACSEADLIGDAQDLEIERERLARYIEQGVIIKKENGHFRMNMPVVNTEDDEKLVKIIDTLAIACVESFVDRAITSFAEQVKALGFGHILTQPNYVGHLGVQRTIDMMVRACVADGILIEPENPHPTYGFYAWYQAPHLTSMK
jgi:hypothetical protein